MTEEGKYLIIRSHRGGKDTWHMATCRRALAARAKQLAAGWTFRSEFASDGSRFHHRIAQEAECCNAAPHIRHDQFPSLYPAPQEETR